MSSSGWFTYERRFVEWAERDGHRARLRHLVATSRTIPGSSTGTTLVLGVGHDEYWSAAQRDTIEAYVAAAATT